MQLPPHFVVLHWGHQLGLSWASLIQTKLLPDSRTPYSTVRRIRSVSPYVGAKRTARIEKMSVFKKGTVSGSSGPVARISGMKAWINGVNLTSSGVLTLDKFIGGGLYVSSCTLLLSDRYSTHAHHMAMCFLAEGLAHKHELFTASLEGDVLDSLPLNVHLAQQRKQQERAAVDKGEGKGEPLEDRDLLNPPGGELKIAWQYKKYLSSPLSLSSQTAAPSFGMPLFPRATTSTPNISKCRLISCIVCLMCFGLGSLTFCPSLSFLCSTILW